MKPTKNLIALFVSTLLIFACDSSQNTDSSTAETGINPATSDVVLAEAEDSTDPTHLGGCILLKPSGSTPADLYQVSDVTHNDEYRPFTKTLKVYGLTLAATDEIPDDFMRLVATTITEIFPQDPGFDLEMQAKAINAHYSYKALIPVPHGEDFSFMENNPELWEALENQNSICDIIMQDVPGQVMEVIEHILHYVSDIGLHYAYPEEWGISATSKLAIAKNKAVDLGYYDISSYDDIDEEEARNRVILQEFAYWFISTAWNLQEPYGPTSEQEWLIKDRQDLRAKLPEFFAVYEQTAERIMTAPNRSTIANFGPTRAQEANE